MRWALYCLLSLLLITIQLEQSTSYRLVPNTIGMLVYDISLNAQFEPDTMKSILRDTYRHKILVFKNQGNISALQQVKISRWFGNRIDGSHRRHPKQEHPLVFRVSKTCLFQPQQITHNMMIGICRAIK